MIFVQQSDYLNSTFSDCLNYKKLFFTFAFCHIYSVFEQIQKLYLENRNNIFTFIIEIKAFLKNRELK
jgi:hypothetical protein